MSGVTDKNGKFSYKQGDEVTFFISNMQMGFSVPGKRCISPFHIAKATTIYGNKDGKFDKKDKQDDPTRLLFSGGF